MGDKIVIFYENYVAPLLAPFGNNLVVALCNFVTVITIVTLFGGVIFPYRQWVKTQRLKRSGYINEYLEKLKTDKAYVDLLYKLDYSDDKKPEHIWYNECFHESTPNDKSESKVPITEDNIDRLLTFFSYICYMRQTDLISSIEFNFFKYEIDRLMKDEQMQDYFYNLYHYSNSVDVQFPFHAIFKYAEDNFYFDEDFYNQESWEKQQKYHNYIKFVKYQPQKNLSYWLNLIRRYIRFTFKEIYLFFK